jgi:hypothetical protein
MIEDSKVCDRMEAQAGTDVGSPSNTSFSFLRQNKLVQILA